MFEELNLNAKTVRDGVDTASMDFVPLSNYIGRTIDVDGFFFTTSKYGKQVVVVGNGCKINMPKRCVETFEKIVNDEKMLNAVLEGKMVLKDIKEKSTKDGDTTIFKFADK